MKLEEKWRVLIIICIGIFMSTVDGSILNIANPTIARELSVSMQEIQWIVTTYMLVITISLLFFGKLGDTLGSSKIYSYGFLIFTIGSLLCSLSPSLFYLVAARIVQAIGASMMMATGIGIVSNIFPQEERGKALGMTGSIVGIGNMTGPSLGGVIIANFSWPVIFLINVPIGLLAFYLGMKYLPRQEKLLDRAKHDHFGLLLFALATIALLFAFSGSHGIEWRLFTLGLILMLSFYLFEKKQPVAILDLALFRIKSFTHGNLMGFATYTTQTSVFFLMPFFLENILYYPPAVSGLIMTIPPVTMAITAPLAGSISDRIGNKKIIPMSFLLMSLAYLLLSTLDQQSGLLTIAGGLLLMGIGVGSFGSPNSSSILGSIPREKAGYAGGFMATVRNFSFSLGIASSVSAFAYFHSLNLAKADHITAYAGAAHSVYRIAATICILAFFLSLLEREPLSEVESSGTWDATSGENG